MEDTINGPLSPECAPELQRRDMSAVSDGCPAGWARLLDCDGNSVCVVPRSIDVTSLAALLNHGNSMYVQGINRGRDEARHMMRASLGL